jgi:hypothetical protein
MVPKGERHITVVLPGLKPVRVIIHELGHVLDWFLGLRHSVRPITDYAETNREEAFAEAFTAWVGPPEYRERCVQEPFYSDGQTTALFRRLQVEGAPWPI